MKRLTIYLLIVLSLSITVNSKVNAAYLYLETKGWFNLKNHKNLEDFLKDYPRPRFENSNKIAGYHNVGKKSTCKDLISLTIKRYTKNIYKICIDENGKDTELYKKLLKYSKKGMCFTHDKRLGKYCRRFISVKYFTKHAKLLGTDFKFGKDSATKITKTEPAKKKKVVKTSQIAKAEPSQTEKINLRNCREVNNLSGNIKFINKEDDPMILKNVNFNLSGKDISFERNKNWHYQGTIYKSKFKFINDTTIESNVIGSWGGPIKVNINYKSGTIKYGQYGNIKLACEKINNNKTIFAKLLDGKSLNTKKTERSKKKKVVKKEITNVGNSKKIKKIIKIDNKEPVKENISSWEKNVLAAIDNEKNDPYCEVKNKNSLKFLSSSKEKNLIKSLKKNYCIKKSDLLQLGEFKKLNLPNFILNEIKGCQTNVCIGQHAGKKVYELFVRRGPIYHARYPGKMINGMVWFEILYYEKFRKLQKILKRYEENRYEGIYKLKKANHEKQIYSLIKLNKGRIKMRKALGFTLYDDNIKVIESQWLLAEFLNKDKLTVSRVKLSPEMHKRKLLIEKYKTLLAKYKKKLEEEKAKKNKS